MPISAVSVINLHTTCKLVGMCYLLWMTHARQCVIRSAEISVYIHPNYHRRGLGRLLVKEMNRIGKQMQFRAIYGKPFHVTIDLCF